MEKKTTKRNKNLLRRYWTGKCYYNLRGKRKTIKMKTNTQKLKRVHQEN